MYTILCKDREDAKAVIDAIGIDAVFDWEFLEGGKVKLFVNGVVLQEDILKHYENLINAVIEKALDDYWRYHPDRYKLAGVEWPLRAQKLFNSAEAFFNSKNLKLFTTIPKEILLSKESVYAEKYKNNSCIQGEYI